MYKNRDDNIVIINKDNDSLSVFYINECNGVCFNYDDKIFIAIKVKDIRVLLHEFAHALSS